MTDGPVTSQDIDDLREAIRQGRPPEDRSDLHKRVATRIRNDVRLHLGPNALGQANAGLSVMLNYGEADAVTDALFAALDDFGLAVVPAGGAEAALDRVQQLADEWDALPGEVRPAAARTLRERISPPEEV